MSRELSYALINPYTIAKSRTGGVIARFIGRTDLGFVGARMFGPSSELVQKYAELVRRSDSENPETCSLLADYVCKSYAPDPLTAKPRRVMLLLFEGEEAVQKMWNVTGGVALRRGSGETIRDTYGDYVLDSHNKVQYFEPAVLVAPSKKHAAATLRLWAAYSGRDGGIIEKASDVSADSRAEKTLVLLKPDNFRFARLRAGNIIDVLSSSGLRIVGVKKFCMTVAQAEAFYASVRKPLTAGFQDSGAERAADALTKEFGFDVPERILRSVCKELGPFFAESQVEDIVQFMTGYRPSECLKSEKAVLGREECLALVYEGVDAVSKIRSLLGPTDPRKAKPGSVRAEFGSDIMVNAAHASDSRDNALRELAIIKVEEDTIGQCVDRYYGNLVTRVLAFRTSLPQARCRLLRKLRGGSPARAVSAEGPPLTRTLHK